MSLTFDDQGNRTRLSRLSEKGVKVWGPERVYVSEEVPLDRISAGAVLINATVSGAKSFIGSGAQIGISGLARIHDAQIGSSTGLGAGSYENCVLLHKSSSRGFAEFRQGTVLEEEAETAHNVGLKNTVLMAGAVAGSSINFCDVLLAGGSSRSDHSEVGSGLVHFNFDPRGDKFGSLMGDATGSLMRSRRIFLGGNSGIVAPVYIEFGAVIAAGSIIRQDVAAKQLAGGGPSPSPAEYDLDRYFDLTRKFCTTAKLIGNLHALSAWYREVRQTCAEIENQLLYTAAAEEFDRHIRQRVRELIKIVDKLEKSLSKPRKNEQDRLFDRQHRRLLANREQIESLLIEVDSSKPPASLLSEYAENRRSRDHSEAVRHLSADTSEIARLWMLKIASRQYLQMRALFNLGA